MKRREFLGAAFAAGLSGSLLPKSAALSGFAGAAMGGDGRLSRKALAVLVSDCREQLFERYLPFWERGGYDREHGGFMCYLYGALFAALGLIQYAKATGSSENIELAKLSLRKSVERYEDPDYRGVVAPGVDATGLRTQGCSFMMVWVIPQLLELEADSWFEALLQEHLDKLGNKFWNPDYGISNEILFHDYSRIPSQAVRMIPGHSIEAQWMCMEEALRIGDMSLYHRFKSRMRRLIEMSWDYTFDGTCDTGYNVFASKEYPAGPVLDIKTMWAQAEVSIGCLMAYEQTGEAWSGEWFERSWAFLQRTMTTDHGVWRQAVDRQGNNKQCEGISSYRRGNFHQPRCLMYLMRIAGRMIARNGELAIHSA